MGDREEQETYTDLADEMLAAKAWIVEDRYIWHPDDRVHMRLLTQFPRPRERETTILARPIFYRHESESPAVTASGSPAVEAFFTVTGGFIDVAYAEETTVTLNRDPGRYHDSEKDHPENHPNEH
jgi:hypothetical protein